MNRFAIPFTFATTLGLAAVALRGNPDMIALTPDDVSAGLPAGAAASALLGKSGAAALLILLFLAVTSACSAELIAVSSILTYDIYKVSLEQSSIVYYISMVQLTDIHQSQSLRSSSITCRACSSMFSFPCNLSPSDHIPKGRVICCYLRPCRPNIFLHWRFHGLAICNPFSQ